MTYGIKSLRRIQFGRESTAGTIIAASTVWRGEGTIEDARVTEFPTEDIGIIPATTRSYQPALASKISLSASPASFEQIGHILEMAVIGTTAGVADGAGTGKVYTYTMPTTTAMYLSPSTSSVPIKSYTIEGGDNNEAEVSEFCHVTDFEISFKAGEAVQCSANIMGRQVALQAFTLSSIATVPTVFDMLSSKAVLYIDSTTATIGTTAITNEVLSGSIKVNSGIKAINTADGALYFSFVKGTRPEITMDVTFEHSTFAKAEKVFWRAGTARQFRVKFLGPLLTTSGTAYANKALFFDMAGAYEKFSALEDTDGDDTITATVRAGYNSTAALFAKFIVVNELTNVP